MSEAVETPPRLRKVKALDQYFGRVFLMTLDPTSERVERSIEGLSQFTDNLEVVTAIRGSELPPAEWYRAGDGAWGCLQTHIRVAQDTWISGHETYIVFEDDVVFDRDFERLLHEFMRDVPENWDQIYLGGQHRKTPRWVSPTTYEARRINRTHCFALRRGTIPEFLNHVTDFKDHMEASYPKHIDHRLEDAHDARRWVTYTPSWWLVGQGSNFSDINGRWHPDKWWDHNPGTSGKLPLIWADREPTEDESWLLHFGWADRGDYKYLDPFFLGKHKDPGKGMRCIAAEAYDCRRVPAIAFYEDGAPEPTPFLAAWEGPVHKLSELSLGKLRDLCDYPRNGSVTHRWLNPQK